jgi:hypothetical protein
MMETNKDPKVKWRIVYGAVLIWLVIMVVLMRWLTKVYS